MLGSITVLLGCQLLGEVIVRLFGLPLPGPVAGMALLLIGLVIRGGIPASLDHTARGFLGYLGLLFVPAGVGIMVQADIIATQALPILIAVVVSTALTLVIAGWTMQGIGRIAARKRR